MDDNVHKANPTAMKFIFTGTGKAARTNDIKARIRSIDEMDIAFPWLKLILSGDHTLKVNSFSIGT